MLKPGLRLKSVVCEAEIMVIKATDGDDLTCGGVAMTESPESADANPDQMDG